MEKEELIQNLKDRKYLRSEKVEKSFREVDREKFVPERLKKEAYTDSPLPIGADQTISAPHMVCIMTELLDPEEEDKVLEIGSGSGYQAAVLSKIVKKIITLENIPELFEKAKKNLKNYGNIKIIDRDGSKGYEKEAPYDKILVTCAAPKLPEPLKEQLASGGKIIIPIGGEYSQNLMVYERENGEFIESNYGSVRFVKMKGEMGF